MTRSDWRAVDEKGTRLGRRYPHAQSQETQSGMAGITFTSDLEADPCQRYALEGNDQFETSAAADQQMNWWVTDTDRRKDRGVRPDRAQGAHEDEAKEHDLPLVRQGRA
jgi:hypothetical protein